MRSTIRWAPSLALAIVAAACNGDQAPQARPTPGPATSVAPSPVEQAVDVQSALDDYVCLNGPAALYRLPPPVYSGTYNGSVDGYKEIAKLRGPECGDVEILSRAPIFPSDAEGVTPNRNQIFQWSYLGDAMGLWVRVDAGSRTGWIQLHTDPALFLPTQSLGGVLEALPVEVPEPLDPRGKPDLAFTTPKAGLKEGDLCLPGEPIPTNLYSLALRNAGKGVAPAPTDVSITRTGFGQRLKVKERDWMRGLEPGEEFPLRLFPAGSRFKADPDDNIPESNEGNNELTLKPLPILVCE
jgi:hypothetical protein